MILLGVGTAGAAIARGVSRAFGESLRIAIVDTDAATGQDGENFTLLGGDRLSGHGSGGDIVAARLAAEDSIQTLDARLEGVRLAVIVTALGGGTGGGATLETVLHLTTLGIPSVVFATTPFLFEGDTRIANARSIAPLIEDAANATFFVPLDKLVLGEDNMVAAMQRAVDAMASGITLFWRLVERSGYIRLDADRIRRLASNAGRGRFATVTVQGPNRAADAVDRLIRSELLATASAPVNAILCGILAGEDLRLSEIATISDGIREAFGNNLTFDLGTVNDESTFSGRLCVVVMLFETSGRTPGTSVGGVLSGQPASRKGKGALGVGPVGRGRFNKVEPTIWRDEDLDVPTFIRKNVNLDF